MKWLFSIGLALLIMLPATLGCSGVAKLGKLSKLAKGAKAARATKLRPNIDRLVKQHKFDLPHVTMLPGANRAAKANRAEVLDLLQTANDLYSVADYANAIAKSESGSEKSGPLSKERVEFLAILELSHYHSGNHEKARSIHPEMSRLAYVVGQNNNKIVADALKLFPTEAPILSVKNGGFVVTGPSTHERSKTHKEIDSCERSLNFYRLGDYQLALTTAENGLKDQNNESEMSKTAVLYGVIAMSNHQLDRAKNANKFRKKFDDAMKLDECKKNDQCKALEIELKELFDRPQ